MPYKRPMLLMVRGTKTFLHQHTLSPGPKQNTRNLLETQQPAQHSVASPTPPDEKPEIIAVPPCSDLRISIAQGAAHAAITKYSCRVIQSISRHSRGFREWHASC
jgi:hypothetical protein